MFYGRPLNSQVAYQSNDVIRITTSSTLSIDSTFKLVLLNSPVNYVVTLPDISTVPFMAAVNFVHNNSTGVVTINVTGSNYISYFGGNTTTLAVYPGTTVTLQADQTTSTWLNVNPSTSYTYPSGTSSTAIATTAFTIAEQSRHVNYFKNPHLTTWQRGTSFTFTNTTSKAYTADKIAAWPGSNSGSCTISRSSLVTNLSDEPLYQLSFSQTVANGSGSNNPTLMFIRESVGTLAGQQITFSFYGTGPGSSVTLNDVTFVQNFGTGGSPSTQVSTSFTSAAGTTVGTSRQRYSFTVTVPNISGKTIGTLGDYVGIAISFPNSATFTILVDTIKIELGPVATNVERLSTEEYNAICRSTYEKVTLNKYVTSPTFLTSPLRSISAPIPFKTPKISSPTITFSGTSATSCTAYNGSLSVAGSSLSTNTISSEFVEVILQCGSNPGFSVTSPSYMDLAGVVIIADCSV